MAGSDKSVKVRLDVDTAPYARGMSSASQSTRKLGSDLDELGAKSKGFASSAGSASTALKGMAIAGAAVAGTALVGFLTDSVRAAGDLEQSIGGVDAVFKESAEQIHAFGETSAEAVGLSRNEFNSLITVTGAMLKNKGLEDFADKSLDLVKIGADLAATYGGSAKDAVEALNAAMRGESDPIERYGISLNETAVNAELAAKGMANLKGAALDQAKAQARIDIITRQSADALGAFTREADTLQGQQQRLTAEWEDAKAELGTALLPALTSVMSALRDGVDVALAAAGAWEQVPGPIKAATVALIAFHIAQKPVNAGLSSIRDGIQRVRDEMALQQALAGGITGGYQKLGDEAEKAGTKVSKAGAAMAVGARAAKGIGSALLGAFGGPIGLAVTGLTAAIGGFIQAQANARQAAEDLAATLDKQSGAFTEQTRTSLLESFFGDFSQADYAKVKGTLEAAGVGVSDLIAAYQKGGPAVDEFKRKFDLFRDSQQNLDGSTPGFTGNIEALGNAYAALGRDTDAARVVAAETADAQTKTATATQDATTEVKQAAPAIDTLRIKQATLAEATKIAAQAHVDLAKAILEISDAAVSADQAEAAWQDSIDKATAAIKENGKTVNKTRTELDLSTEAGRNNQDALIGLRDAAVKNSEALLTQGDSTQSVKDKMKAARTEFIDAARDMGLNKKSAEKLATQYGLTEDTVDDLNAAIGETPAETKTRITAETAAAETAIAGVAALLKALDGKQITVGVTAATAGAVASINNVGSLFGWKKKATGGYISGPGTATSDSIPALLSNGEYVLKAAAVAKYGKRQLDDMNAMRFAQGGFVSRVSAPTSGGGVDLGALADLIGDRTVINASGLTTEQVAAGVSRGVRDNMFKRSRG